MLIILVLSSLFYWFLILGCRCSIDIVGILLKTVGSIGSLFSESINQRFKNTNNFLLKNSGIKVMYFKSGSYLARGLCLVACPRHKSGEPGISSHFRISS